GYTSLTFACSPAGSQEVDIKTLFLIQALRYNKGYRDRIARSLSLPVAILEAESDILDAA
ncbi:XRE family transcriptional regulator, partial [Mesorhizobium sp. M0166]